MPLSQAPAMLAGVDLSTPEAVERLRRSVAMLPPQAPALDREQAMAVLEALLRRWARAEG